MNGVSLGRLKREKRSSFFKKRQPFFEKTVQFCAVNAALMDTTVWIVIFDPEFISSSGFFSLVLIQSSRGHHFFCDLTGFKIAIETKQRLEGLCCTQNFL